MSGSRPLFLLPVLLSALLVACGGGGSGSSGEPGSPGDPPAPAEFLATVDDFVGFETWTLLDYDIGTVRPELATAHRGADDRYSRAVWSKGGTLSGGTAPVGTVLVLETFTWSGTAKEYAPEDGLLGLAKRGGDFNPGEGGWEWFRLETDLSAIAERGGAGFAVGSCASCHAGGADRVFPHPVDPVPASIDFAGFTAWAGIDESSGSGPLLRGWHEYSSATLRRRIYKTPLLARPLDALGGYPTGTRIVKSVEDDAGTFEVSAMVKRGDGFASAHGDWEWFDLHKVTHEIRTRGADLVNGACANCHEDAEDPLLGADYVFRHAGDPFNR